MLCSPSTLCRHIGLLFVCHRIKKYPDSPIHTLSDSLRLYFFPFWSPPHVIGFVADIFFSTLESGLIFFRIRCRIRRIRVDGSRIRKEKVADSKISGYVWTGPQFGEVLRRILSPQEHGMTFKLSGEHNNSVKFKTTFVGEHTTYLTLKERVNTL